MFTHKYDWEPDSINDETVCLEFEVEFDYSPGCPAVMYLKNGDPGYPEEPAELDVTHFSLNKISFRDTERKPSAFERAYWQERFENEMVDTGEIDEYLYEVGPGALAEDRDAALEAQYDEWKEERRAIC